jgi:hypothetical protein
MSDEGEPPKDDPEARRPGDAPPPPPFDPEHELIGYLEEREGQLPDRRGR